MIFRSPDLLLLNRDPMKFSHLSLSQWSQSRTKSLRSRRDRWLVRQAIQTIRFIPRRQPLKRKKDRTKSTSKGNSWKLSKSKINNNKNSNNCSNKLNLIHASSQSRSDRSSKIRTLLNKRKTTKTTMTSLKMNRLASILVFLSR
jgi:hypothetical protein